MLAPHKFFSHPRESCAASSVHDVPSLPLLNLIVQVLHGKIDFSKTAIVSVQHILETTASLFKAFIELGVRPERLYCIGKPYSTCPEVARAFKKLKVQLLPDVMPAMVGEYQESSRVGIRSLWQKVEMDLQSNGIDTIIVIDDGGRGFEEMPRWLRFNYKVAGVEQTRAGLYSTTLTDTLPFPLVEVASSAAKRFIEPPLIIEAVFEGIKGRILALEINERTVCGVIGNGAIGNALVGFLAQKGATVLVYDESAQSFQQVAFYNKFHRMDGIFSLIENSDYVFGCTGRDITQGINTLDACKGKRKTFISCTSEDKEFFSFLKVVAKCNLSKTINPLSDINFSINGCDVLIMSGGYPVNFNGSPSSVPPRDIELTRCLLLLGFVQAFLAAEKPVPDGITPHKTKRLQLNPFLQRFVALLWGQRQRFENSQKYSSELMDNFRDIQWIIKNSGEGRLFDHHFLRNFFFLPPREMLRITYPSCSPQSPLDRSPTANPTTSTAENAPTNKLSSSL